MLLILQSFIVYGLMIWVMTYFGKVAYKVQYPLRFGNIDRLGNKNISFISLFTKSYFVIPIFVFSLFAALRYRVGVDCESYKESFYEIATFGELLRTQDIEPAFDFLTNFTLTFTKSHYFLFFILALIQIGLYYYSFIKETYVLIFLSLALFLTGEYWSWMNGMRQIIASCFFLAATNFVINKKWMTFFIITFIASLMHRSALIILPLGFILYLFKNNILNKYLQIVIFIACFFMMNRFNNFTETLIQVIGMNLGYNEAKIEGYAELDATVITFGLRSYLLYASFLIIIFFSDKMKEFYNSSKFNYCYNAFFIAICLGLIFYNNFALNRILYYLSIFIPAVVSYFLFCCYYLKKQYVIIATTTILLLSARTLYNFHSELGNKFEYIYYKFDL